MAASITCEPVNVQVSKEAKRRNVAPQIASSTRVLILVHGYPPTYTGGAEQRAARTAQALHQRGCAVRVLCIEAMSEHYPHVYWKDTLQDHIPVRRLFCPASSGDTSFSESYDNPHTRDALVVLLQEWRPDIVYVFSGYMMSASVVRAAKDRGLPVVIALTDYWWLCHRINLLRTSGERCSGPEPVACARCLAETLRRYRLPARAIPGAANVFWSTVATTPRLAEQVGVDQQVDRFALLMDTLRQADALISPSYYLAHVYVAYGADPARMHIWRQGVAVDRCVLPTPSPTLRIGYLGQMKPHKGVNLLLDAWQQLRGSRARSLTLYGSALGETGYGERLRKRIDTLNNVQWNGHYVGEQVWNVLAELDVIVVPSRWVENSPNSILEAQAVGVPVIGSNLGGIAELVQHNVNGLLFAPDDRADLARQLQSLLDEPSLLKRLRYARTPFSTDETQLDRIFTLFHQLAGKIAS